MSAKDNKRAARRATVLQALMGVNTDKRKKVPTLGQFAEDLVIEVGGSRNLARMIIAELKTASGQTKQRLLESVTRVIVAAGRNQPSPLNDLENMTDEDLLLALDEEIEGVETEDDWQEEENTDNDAAEGSGASG